MSLIRNIILHCSDSTWGCAREIRKWHLQRGWSDIGYHFVIPNGKPLPGFYIPSFDGSLECGRTLDEDLMITGDEVGAHALGYNINSIGICLVGINQFTSKQISTMMTLLKFLKSHYGIPYENIIGHNETESGKAQGKTCPNFDVGMVRKSLKQGEI